MTVAQLAPASGLLKMVPVLLPNEAYKMDGFCGSTATVAALVKGKMEVHKGKMEVHVAPASVLLKIPALLEEAYYFGTETVGAVDKLMVN